MIKAPSTDVAIQELSQSTAEVSEIVFFLLGAMTIVEIVDSHQGFKLVTDNISTRNPKTLLWVVSLSYFYILLTERHIMSGTPSVRKSLSLKWMYLAPS